MLVCAVGPNYSQHTVCVVRIVKSVAKKHSDLVTLNSFDFL